MKHIQFSSEEAPFYFEELFFSRTDRKGRIISGNDVFGRVSEYDWDDLIGKPHNVIRHQDMPRGVFFLFWEMIQAGKPIGAFVKNKSKTGKYYWVFALALPIGDQGFLSIRLRPRGQIYEKSKVLYEDLLKEESKNSLKPEQSKSRLIEKIKSLGFESYEAFMSEALMSVLQEREEFLFGQKSSTVQELERALQSSAYVQKNSVQVQKAYQQAAHVPLNLEIKAHSLGVKAAGLSVVASQYDKMAEEIKQAMIRFLSFTANLKVKIQDVQFEVCAKYLQNEMLHRFQSETYLQGEKRQIEEGFLKNLEKEADIKSRMVLQEIQSELSSFLRRCDELHLMMSGLEIVRISGRVEMAQIEYGDSELKDLIAQLQVFKNVASKNLSLIIDHSKSMKESCRKVAAYSCVT